MGSFIFLFFIPICMNVVRRPPTIALRLRARTGTGAYPYINPFQTLS